MCKIGRENEDRSGKRAKIRALNDAFRQSFWGGRVMMTAGVAALENPVRNAVVEKIKAFDAFDDDNDPWGQHDFVSVEHDGQTYFGVSLSSALPLPSPFLFLAARRKASISDRSAVAMRFSASSCIR